MTPSAPAWRAVAGVALVILVASPTAPARSTPAAPAEVAAAALPAEAQQTLGLIKSRGPFPYQRDGVVFANREQLLPPQRRGYYHEYTVKTPGADTRAGRRIVCGGEPGSLAECYYSDDHYQSFRRIRP